MPSTMTWNIATRRVQCGVHVLAGRRFSMYTAELALLNAQNDERAGA